MLLQVGLSNYFTGQIAARHRGIDDDDFGIISRGIWREARRGWRLKPFSKRSVRWMREPDGRFAG